ncbi:hypothetical protein M9H77_17466 [Catharanthus roseus]|uniref:Uncharacterized protein n=1 Tax=Catharanthus roseus TaxID=4058 RepID=A0ACC0B512_CATRO|nr:hypothetical protein M9H77_17466 [Catharanthus roseus]
MLLRRLRRTGCRKKHDRGSSLLKCTTGSFKKVIMVQYVTIGRVWTSEVLHFGVETTNRAKSEHSVLKLWLLTCHGQIVEIKTSLEISKLKEKYDAKSNPILKNISNNINHLALKKICLEIKRVRKIFDDP